MHQCLLHLWTQQQTPGWLQWNWLCPKPKNPEEEITLDGLHPLLLLEVIRKLWTGIIVVRITRAWERHHVRATAQQGFRPSRGTDTASSNSSMRGNMPRRLVPHCTLQAGHPTCLRFGVARGHGTVLDTPRCPPPSSRVASGHGCIGCHKHGGCTDTRGSEPPPPWTAQTRHKGMSPAPTTGPASSTSPSGP